ncbi:MAG: WD40 repeat domain-containing protein [Candidatus Thorarchaeota archaeon]|nr:WD40 repeat domain-containing protein [Candidatus Thorarchaeota archaeon]
MEKTILFRQENGLLFPLTCLSIDSKGRYVVCGNTDANIFVVDTKSGKIKNTITGHEGAISATLFIGDRNKILSCSWDNTTRLWESKGAEEPTILKHGSEVKSLTTTPDQGKGAAGSRDGEVKVFSLNTLKSMRNLQAHGTDITGLAFIKEGSKLVTSSLDGECKIWDMSSYEVEFQLSRIKENIRAIATNIDGSKLALGLRSGKILLIDIENPTKMKELVGHSDIISSLSIDSTGERLASGSWDRTLRIWSLNSLKEISTGSLLSGITAVQWDPKNEVVFSADFAGTVTSWSI